MNGTHRCINGRQQKWHVLFWGYVAMDIVITVTMATYSHSSGSCHTPFSRNSNVALWEESQDDAYWWEELTDRTTTTKTTTIFSLPTPSITQSPKFPRSPSDTYRNTWLSRWSCFSHFSWISLRNEKEAEDTGIVGKMLWLSVWLIGSPLSHVSLVVCACHTHNSSFRSFSTSPSLQTLKQWITNMN